MGTVTSSLILRLVDHVSGPAQRVKKGIREIDAAGRAAERRSRMMGPGVIARSSAIVPLIGGAAAAAAARKAMTEYATFDRRMTRIGITAGATRSEVMAATRAVKELATEVALPLDNVTEGLASLVSTGMDMKEAMAFLPSVARAAQASGAATDDMAKSAVALATSLKVTAAEMPAVFDSLVEAGNLGQFELNDMALFLPKVAASATKVGYAGLDGAQRLATMLQIVRQVSGTAEQAATGASDAFEKILSPTVLKAALKQGMDFGKILKLAEKNGTNGFEAVIGRLREATKNMSATQRNIFLSSIFSESDSRRAVVAMIEHWDEFEDKLAKVRNSSGATQRALGNITGDAQAAVQRLTNAWDKLWLSLGRTADAAGASKAMEGIASAADRAAGLMESPDARAEAAESFAETQARGQAEAHKREVDEKIRQREESFKAAADEAERDAKRWNRDPERRKKSEQRAKDMRAALAIDPVLEELRARSKALEDQIAELRAKELQRQFKASEAASAKAQAPASAFSKEEAAGAIGAAPSYSPLTPPMPKPNPRRPLPPPDSALRVQPVPSDGQGDPTNTPFADPPVEGKASPSSDRTKGARIPPPAFAPGDAAAAQAAQSTMGAYRRELTSEMAAVEQQVASFVQRIQQMLAFSASPTITPSFGGVPRAPTPSAAPAPAGSGQGRQSSLRPRSPPHFPSLRDGIYATTAQTEFG